MSVLEVMLKTNYIELRLFYLRVPKFIGYEYLEIMPTKKTIAIEKTTESNKKSNIQRTPQKSNHSIGNANSHNR